MIDKLHRLCKQNNFLLTLKQSFVERHHYFQKMWCMFGNEKKFVFSQFCKKINICRLSWKSENSVCQKLKTLFGIMLNCNIFQQINNVCALTLLTFCSLPLPSSCPALAFASFVVLVCLNNNNNNNVLNCMLTLRRSNKKWRRWSTEGSL